MGRQRGSQPLMFAHEPFLPSLNCLGRCPHLVWKSYRIGCPQSPHLLDLMGEMKDFRHNLNISGRL